MKRHRRLAASLAVAVLALAASLLSASGGFAQDAGERITEYHVTVTVTAGGEIDVLEEIAYDFGASERHGIFRDVPVRAPYDDTHDRVYPATVLAVSADGEPAEYEADEDDGVLSLRIGDPDRTVTGEHTYSILYRLRGVLNHFESHDELYWNVTGHQWDVPIDSVTVVVDAPAEVQDALCFAGPERSNLPCDNVARNDQRATFQHAALQPHEGVTVVVAIPTGAVTSTAPILEERWSLRRAFSLTPFTVATTTLLSVAVLGAVMRTLWTVGRDRRWRGSAVDARFGSSGGDTERVPLFEGSPFPVEYSPPGNLRPGLIGTLRDEVAQPLDVTATIIDLATRHFLRIEEIAASEASSGSKDWRLVRLAPPRDQLATYERLLLDALFQDGDRVELSSLNRTFRSRLESVQDALYEATVERGWYRRKPNETRTRWLVIGLLALAASIAVFVAALVWTEWALIPIPLMVGSIVLVAGYYATPSRTAEGSATLGRVRGFERFIASAEIYRARFAEQSRIFYDYLPYAVVFGLTDEWARAFEGLDDLPPPDWYVGPSYLGALALSNNISGFTRESAGAIAATPASSGSSGFGGGGFSGGGAGGGGGGSW